MSRGQDNGTADNIRDPEAFMLVRGRTGRLGKLEMAVMYVTINFLSCFNVDKAHLLDATWCVFELGLEVEAWHDGLCNNKRHFIYSIQRVTYANGTSSHAAGAPEIDQSRLRRRTSLSRHHCLLTGNALQSGNFSHWRQHRTQK